MASDTEKMDPFAANDAQPLTKEEREVLAMQTAGPATWPNSAAFVLKCTSVFDGIALIISGLAAIISGAAFPFSFLFLGNVSQSFKGYFVGNTTLSDFNDEVHQLSLFYVYLAVVQFISTYVATVGFAMAGEHIAQRIREKYLEAVLRQNIAYFESLEVGEVNTRITTDANLIQDAITGKASLTLSAIATFVSAFIISFVKSWLLALVLLPSLVLILATMSVGSAVMVKHAGRSLAAYSSGASIVEEAVTSIQTVTAFGMQGSLAQRYEKHVTAARGAGLRSGLALAAMIAALNTVVFWTHGLAFWSGSIFMVKGEISLSAILTILFASMTGAYALGNVMPHVQAFVSGITATDKISQTVFRRSPIDSSLPTGEKLPLVHGTIELRNIRHAYPSRPDSLILNHVDMVFPQGTMTAIAGPSGCGKSTIGCLLERLYEPASGNIYLDGHNITALNVSWLRQQIGMVSQEPTLFSGTIFDNIRHGLVGTPYEHLTEGNSVEIDRLVENAASIANASSFIAALPDGFQTNVGEMGSLLSGGQKQRIAIARAIVKDPKILILDEATSALDSNAERLVQQALEKAAQGRTTIAIAHRLSTISRADNIIVMSGGRIVEQGKHAQLMENGSTYYQMVKQQNMETESTPSIDTIQESSATDLEKNMAQVSKASQDEGEKESTGHKLSSEQSRPNSVDSFSSLARFVFNLNRGGLTVMVGGLLLSIVAGASHPTQAIFLAKNMSALSLQPDMYSVLRTEVNFWSLMYLMIGFTTFIGWFGQGVCFAFYSQGLTYQARTGGFDAILHQDMSTLLDEDHSASALTTILSTGASNLQGMSGVVLGTVLVILTTLVAGFVLAVAVGWKLALVCTCTVPIQLGCGFLRLKTLGSLESHSRKVYETSAAYASEFSAGIRTVTPLTLEKKILRDYHAILETQRRGSLAFVSRSSLLYAASQSISFLCASLAFWYGGRLIVTDGYTLFQFYVCYTAIITGSLSAGAIFSFAPDMGKAKAAARDLKGLFEHPVEIDSRSAAGLVFPHIDGSVELDNVTFRYQNRPEQTVLDRISLKIGGGKFIAVVGASGSGKTTMISLIERFFDPEDGKIMVNGTDVRSWNLKSLRSHMALVSQMPTLFDGTIRDNIVIGVEDSNISEETVIKACKDANIYDFICSLSDGFNTVVGARGAMLSGGQKQRIAIARALLRNPKLLLLDEATSALDSDSEKAVQAALDTAARGRTTIAVAHRLSTVERADWIYGKSNLWLQILFNDILINSVVLDHGQIAEQGTHQDLVELKGKYFELVKLQRIC